jgi:DNA-directed RNA polymerase subunit RPC12/RpoP/DNA-binding MarR family transcriptional regulator
MQVRTVTVHAVNVEYDEFGFIKDYVCPRCGAKVKFSHEDDIGTKFFKCKKCGQCSSKLKTPARQQLETTLKELTKPVSLEEVSEILNSTIKHDERNKLITFLTMILTYTEEDQINLSFTAESSTGKSYIPLELAWYFPKTDVLEYGYVSPTAFFHEYGTLLPDPLDIRDVEDSKKQKIIYINLHQKILIFMDQPHDQLLQRLRPLLSHDRKTITHKITDRRKIAGLKTKTVFIEGYPTVIFCTARFTMADQERTRLLLLSPETTEQKIKDAILLKIEKESDRQAFHDFMESDPKRVLLHDRVLAIAQSKVKYIIIPEELRNQIAERFFQKHNTLIPRHQRDIGRLLALIKAHAFLNLWHRETMENAIVVNDEDVAEGFKLYEEISAANELGLPPEVHNIYAKLEDQIPDEGLTRKELQTAYYQIFHRTVGKKRLDQVLSLLETVGLLTEEPDPNDRRQKRFLLTPRGVYISSMENQHPNNVEKINTPEGVSNSHQEILVIPPRAYTSESFYPTCWICRETIRLNEAFKPHNGKPAHLGCIEKIDSAQCE